MKQDMLIVLLIAAVLIALLIIGVVIIRKKKQKASFIGEITNNTIKVVMRAVNGDRDRTKVMLAERPKKPYNYKTWTPPEGYSNDLVSLSKSKGYLLTKEDGDHEKVIYHLHGGAYIIFYQAYYNKVAVKYSKAYDDADVFSLDYRTAPDAYHPAALEDALEGYEWLLKHGYHPKNIIVTGDSAGGGLSLALSLYLRDHEKAMPRKLILSSPWTDLTQEGESYKKNMKTDVFFGSKSARKSPRYPVPILYAGDSDLKEPYLSPIFADYKGMPPMLIQSATDEMLLSDSTTVVEKVQASGGKVEFFEYKGMFHTFYVTMPSLPESKQAWKRVYEFIHKD